MNGASRISRRLFCSMAAAGLPRPAAAPGAAKQLTELNRK